MTDRVVVLGAGYAGTTAVERLERDLDDATVTWVSDREYHLVLHEVHRAIRDPDVREHITVPIEEIKAPSTEFVQGWVSDVDTGARQVHLADGDPIEYDYLLVALGSDTAFYGIPGLEEHAHTLKTLDDALAIHDDIADAAGDATASDPARVVIGGGGISGVQAAGEVAAYREEAGADIEITLVEALEEIMPGRDPELRERVRGMLEERGVEVLTDDPVVEAGAEEVSFDERDPIPYDVFVWTGGITGREALSGAGVETNHNRVTADATFATSDDRVFAVGDSAIIDVDGEEVPPTAQAAWDAAEVAAGNVARAVEGRPPRSWSHTDKGTVLSIGESAVASDVLYLPVSTFDSLPARLLKKLIAARWIAGVASWPRALRAWGAL